MDRVVHIELRNIIETSGKIYVAIYDSETSYKKGRSFKSYILDSKKSVITITDKIPEGNYVISVFQDLNNNGKLDMNIIGIPKEPIGLSNYDGKGMPGGFDKLKIEVFEDNQTTVIKMIKIF